MARTSLCVAEVSFVMEDTGVNNLIPEAQIARWVIIDTTKKGLG